MTKFNLEKCKSSNKGITLIALIITIIVLLILAGITISALTGSDSAPAKANEAKQKNDIGAVKDEIALTVQNAQMDAYDDIYAKNNSAVKSTSATTTVGQRVINAVLEHFGGTARTGSNTAELTATDTKGLVSVSITQASGTADAEITLATRDFTQEGTIAHDGGTLTWEALKNNSGNQQQGGNETGDNDEEVLEVLSQIDYDPQQFFTYEVLTTAQNQDTDIEGVASVSKVADNSNSLKVADNTVGTAKIVGFNYDYIFDGIPYSGSGSDSNSNSTSSSGSSSNDPLANRIKEKFSTLVIPGTVKLGTNGKYDANGTKYNVVDMSELDLRDGVDYAIRENVDTVYMSKNNISNSVFGDWFGLRTLYIPSTMTNFIELSQQVSESIKVSSNNSVYDSRNNCNAIIESATDTLLLGTNTTVIPSDVKKIGRNAFKGLTMDSIVVPEQVQSIEEGAFAGSDLTSITLPSSLTEIKVWAFSMCDSLQTVYYTGTPEQWAAITIESGNDKLKNANIVYNYTP